METWIQETFLGVLCAGIRPEGTGSGTGSSRTGGCIQCGQNPGPSQQMVPIKYLKFSEKDRAFVPHSDKSLDMDWPKKQT